MNKKDKVVELKEQGMINSEIANLLDIPINTVRSIWYRSGRANTYVNEKTCLNCHGNLIQIGKGRKKKFCSDKCRLEWWNKNSNKLRKKAYYKRKCLYCGREFELYGRPHAKYCSHICYITRRYHAAL